MSVESPPNPPVNLAIASPRSLEGFHSTVPVPPARASFVRQLRAFAGPAFLVSVGYMDPGNWGTDIKAGAVYGYHLLWVVLAASLMAIVMQVLSARLGIVTGKDLAQACRDFYPGWTRWPNWIACEVAIAACDLAELLGSAVALNLLFKIPIFWAVCITAFDVLLLLALQGLGMRFIEAVILVLVGTIGACYFLEIFVLPHTQPNFTDMGQALLRPGFPDGNAMLLAVGIIGATVMPHNLYLHSALVNSRRLRTDEQNLATAIRFNTLDTVLALSAAFLVNAAILVLAAMVFYDFENQQARQTITLLDGEVVPLSKEADPQKKEPDWIFLGWRTLPLLGTTAASLLFAVALLASGQSSTITGTLAGQVVMEGFMHWRIRPWARRLFTRLLAILPAVIIMGVRRNNMRVTDLLILTQVVLAMQLPLAMFPLLHFTSSRQRMGRFASGWFLLIAGWGSCLLITTLAIFSLPEACSDAWELLTSE